jgi:hypothetical protein
MTAHSLAILALESEIILCRIMAPRSTLTICKGDILCYDTCIKLQSGTSSLSLSDLTRAFPLGSTAYKISEYEDPTTINRGENHLGHHHVTIQERIPEDAKNTSTPRPLLVLVSVDHPMPLVSLTLLMKNRDAKNQNQEDPFQQAHRKRELVGKVVLHSTKTLPLSTTLTMEQVTYEIQSLAAMGMSTNTAGVCYKILPSTRITFLPYPESPRKEPNSNNGMKSSIPSTSPVSDLISQTIRCIQRGIPAPQTFLLSGPPGVGKTYSIQLALQQDYPRKVTFQSIRGSELLQEPNPARALQQVFARATTTTTTTTTTDSSTTCLLFLDECDALVSVDSVAAMLATILDQISSPSPTSTRNKTTNIIVVGATNRIDSIPQYLRRAGRFDREVPLAPPNSRERAKILSSLLPDEPDPQAIAKIAELCVGYVPADLTALARRATVLAIQKQSTRSSSHSPQQSRTVVDYLPAAMKDVGASALRDAALAAPPKISWSDIAGDPGGAKVRDRNYESISPAFVCF